MMTQSNTDSEETGAIQLGGAGVTLVASTGGVVTAHTALGTITLEPVLGSDLWFVARRFAGRVTRTIPVRFAEANRVFKSLTA